MRELTFSKAIPSSEALGRCFFWSQQRILKLSRRVRVGEGQRGMLQMVFFLLVLSLLPFYLLHKVAPSLIQFYLLVKKKKHLYVVTIEESCRQTYFPTLIIFNLITAPLFFEFFWLAVIFLYVGHGVCACVLW